MALSAGTQLGPYEILSPIGAGGMGEVYRARDTRLDREVAVKVLPAHLTASGESKQRFEREARTVSKLSHPNICTLHDIGHEGGVDYLVMEYLEGETLAQRLARGALPIEQALRTGAEIASALDRAHRAGVVHRDLKPGNIMLTKAGAKLLDFGLAKTMAGSGVSSAPDAATLTEPLTGKGTIVGTFQYMAPEQLEGRDADARTDIFALGAVLYEMVTGKRAFSGKSRASLIASIMSANPRAISELQPMTPPALDHVVRTCLAKDPDDRIQTAHDVKLQLQWIAEGGSQLGVPAAVGARRKGRERAWIASTYALLLVTAGLAIGYFRATRKPSQLIHAAIPAPQDARFVFTSDAGGPAVISPDGRTIVFTARCSDGLNRIWVRPLDGPSPRALSGTEGAYNPFCSPDGRSIAFFADEKLKRIDLSGGFPVVLCDALFGKGGAWNGDGTILIAPEFQQPIFRIPDTGGTPVAVTQLEGTRYTTHRWPTFLPDGRHFLYFAGNHDLSRRVDDAVFFASLDGSTNKKIVNTRGNAIFASGHLLYLRNDTLMARPFDPGRGVFTEEPTPVAHRVQYDPGVWRGVFSASETGTLIYQTGTVRSGTTLTWFDRTGKDLGTLGDQAVYDGMLRLSPDGNRLVTAVGDPSDIWTFDLQRGVRTRITTEPVDERPAIWSPDGSRVVYTSRNRPDKKKVLYVKASNGIGAAELLMEFDYEVGVADWSPDGRFLLVYHEADDGKSWIHLLTLDAERRLIPLFDTSFLAAGAMFSPDGRWIAYASDESGRYELYVVPFCPPAEDVSAVATCDREGRWQISAAGGGRPLWSRDGKTLYYQSLDRTIMAVSVDGTGEEFETGVEEPLFTPDVSATNIPGRAGVGFAYDVTKDGERFIVNTFGSGDATPLTLVINWPQLLDRP